MAHTPSAVLPKAMLTGHRRDAPIRVSPILLEVASVEPAAVHARLATRTEGMTSGEAAARLAAHGPNMLARDQRPSPREAALARRDQSAGDPARGSRDGLVRDRRPVTV